MPMIFFNVYYMEHYDGPEELRGGFAFRPVDAKGRVIAGEIFNFRRYDDGFHYGYARRDGIRLERVCCPNGQILTDRNGNRYLRNVTVVFMGRYPGDETRVVGWYRDAILYEERQNDGPNGTPGNPGMYLVKSRNAFCLPEEERTMTVQTSRGHGTGNGYGQSAVWYADAGTRYERELRESIAEFIQNYQGRRRAGGRHGRAADPEYNRLVEQTAVMTAISHYRKRGFTIEDVQDQYCGWDLTVTLEKQTYYVEVKGNASDVPHIRLTANEYRALQENYRKYRIASVTGCREGGTPCLREYSIGRHSKPGKGIFFVRNSRGKVSDLVESVTASILPER